MTASGTVHIIMSAGRAGGNGRRTGLKILWTEVHAGSIPAPGTKTATRPLSRGGAVRKLVGLITRRSQVQILPPQPKRRCSSVGESMRFIPAVSVVRLHSPPPFLKKPENGRLVPSPSDFSLFRSKTRLLACNQLYEPGRRCLFQGLCVITFGKVDNKANRGVEQSGSSSGS